MQAADQLFAAYVAEGGEAHTLLVRGSDISGGKVLPDYLLLWLLPC